MNKVKQVLFGRDHFEEIKPIIVEEFVNVYGENYRDLIINKIDSIYCYFDSNPDQKSKFAENNSLELHDSYLLSKLMHDRRIYEYYKKKITKEIMYEFSQYVNDRFNLYPGRLSHRNAKKIFEAYYVDNDSKTTVDSFSTYNMGLLNDDALAEEFKILILAKQKSFLQHCIDRNVTPVTDSKKVDDIISISQIFDDALKMRIIGKIGYPELVYEIANKEKINFTNEQLIDLCYLKSKAATITYEYSPTHYVNLLVIPFAAIANMNHSIDVTLIHELIHVIETNMDKVGLNKNEDNNKIYNIFDEVRVQRLAVKIANKLREKGIYLFEIDKGKKVEDSASYEMVNSITVPFIEKYEKDICEASINNSPENLEALFGKDNLYEYLNYINSAYELIIDAIRVSDRTDLDARFHEGRSFKKAVENLHAGYKMNTSLKREKK